MIWYDTTMISRICNRNRSRLCKICRSFMHIWIRSFLRVRCPLKILLGIISHSNIVRHDQWPAFLYNLIQISYYSYFYYLAVPFVKDPPRPPSFVKRTRHYRTTSIDYFVLDYYTTSSNIIKSRVHFILHQCDLDFEIVSRFFILLNEAHNSFGR